MTDPKKNKPEWLEYVRISGHARCVRDERTGLPPRAAGALHDVTWEKPLHPRNIIRQTVYCQSAIRRFLYRCRLARGVTPLKKPNSPPVSTALFFCRYLRSPDFLNVEDEAVCICALICGREEGKALKIGDLSDAYSEYSLHLRPGHAALKMLLARFDDLIVLAEEEALDKIQDVTIPSDAEGKLREVMMKWRCPEERPGPTEKGGALFKLAKDLIDKLRLDHEQVLVNRLPIVNNQRAYADMMAEVEREFVATRTILRGQLRAGRNRQRSLLETEMQTIYGWPPTGPGPALKRAARINVNELGSEHPVVEDFVSAARRHVKMKEDRCVQEMAPLEKEILDLRALYESDPPAPKLMRDNYREELNKLCLEAMQKLADWKSNLGEDSFTYLRFLKSTMGVPAFLDDCEERAEAKGVELRYLGPPARPSMEENHVTEARFLGMTALTYILEILEAGGNGAQAGSPWAREEIVQAAKSAQKKAAGLRVEFAADLAKVKVAVKLFKDEEDDEGGWHRPPGFDEVDAALKVERPPTPPPPPEFRMERELPGMRDAQSLQMRLHGVDFADVKRHNEFLLLEMCADVIAEECGIPRDCIFNLSFTFLTPPQETPEESFMESSKELATEDSKESMASLKNPLLQQPDCPYDALDHVDEL